MIGNASPGQAMPVITIAYALYPVGEARQWLRLYNLTNVCIYATVILMGGSLVST